MENQTNTHYEKGNKGMNFSEVYKHVDKIGNFDAQKTYLQGVLDKKNLYSKNTQESVLDNLEFLYNFEAKQCELTDKNHLDLKKELCSKLRNQGYQSRADSQLRKLENQIRDSMNNNPNPNHYERYVTHRSHFGCGYEDTQTSYEGFNQEGYDHACKKYIETRGILRKVLDDIILTQNNAKSNLIGCNEVK